MPSDRFRRRVDALLPFSREHHLALVQALKLKRATAADATDVADDFLRFWEQDGRRHFVDEEERLLPVYARHAGHEDDNVLRTLVDHVWLRERIDALVHGADATPARLHELGHRLEEHVRFEERVLFPAVEERLPSDELDRIQSYIG